MEWTRSTKKVRAEERIESQWGQVVPVDVDGIDAFQIDERKTWAMWCNLEAARIIRAGGNARVGSSHDEENDCTWCWLERPAVSQMEVKDD